MAVGNVAGGFGFRGLKKKGSAVAHRHDVRVYYEDTDLAGIVYYANYLKFIERGRSEWVRSLGVDQGRLRAEEGIVFAVRRVEADYLRPAVFDDLLAVTTELVELGGAKIVLDQAVWRGEVRLFAARVVLVCVGPAMGAARIPAAVRAALQGG
ncbi:tol-pal system-associated acyl-CoA thioesterase [Pseudotabrizicola sp.]|uniref:tol-pal system-associated acyl-CoA thioesterase n=1 Tax=Pseudotabrizicola sp. TaxID=2939647 RepID=UPI00352230D1